MQKTTQSSDEMAKTVSIDNINVDFKVPQSEIEEMNEKCEVETIANHFQVLRVSIDEWCCLNPELVPDTNSTHKKRNFY